ncbi:hypothetical protein A1O3_09472 [Capronia epimyces CBS 606.96]|uniref:RING-type E3 ubiquitin transferase n=1 Tax=Capronia epimyces CBS 606.96 TaxID=1182542 RepID=W9XMW3_9EURO|nr:uncharacterized protein A1O3_09472 [Capronia epimyces CBS 606.96]EXJ78311.1 hypothetical protein A1O3_09472 [Capronia epimyces CBS 606.96]
MPARMRMRMRWTAYTGVSTALAAGVILKALAQRPNFYSAAVYLSQSSANLMVLTNLLFVVACTFLLGLQKLLYGNLRPIEIEQLYEKAWFAVTETCLAMTVFRGEVGLAFLAMFFALLTGKVWGWIGEGRVEVLEQQPPRSPRLFHTRLALSLGLSVAFDLTMLEYVVKQVMRMARPDMMVMFGFEFAVLSIMSISTAMRYAIDLVEIGIVREQKRLRTEEIKRERVQAALLEFQEAQDTQATTGPTPTQRSIEQVSQEALRQPVDENEVEVEGWEEKGRYMFYLNLTTDFFKLVIYLAFFFILLVFYGLPIHILRDVFLTMRSFLKRISDFIKYRAATRDMNARYPDATEEDIGREDVCIICREEMRPYQPPAAEAGQAQPRGNPVAERMRPKKLPCGHVLHFSCLRSWLERQQICPTCRANVVRGGRAGDDAGGAGQPGVAQGQDGQPQPGGRQGPRIYQFGPLRFGVGAVRGNNMFEELQQQLDDVRQVAAPAQGPAPANGDANAPHQFGVGIRWTGARRQQTGEHNMTTQEQLDALRAQLDRELQELAHSSAELSVLRSMQTEMQRLRNSRPGETPNNTNLEGQGPGPAHQARPVPRFPRVAQTLAAAGPHEVIHAGSDRLPPGLVLPEGWSMMPLRPTTLDPNRLAFPSSIRGFVPGVDMMQRRLPNNEFGWLPQPPPPFPHQAEQNGAGLGPAAPLYVQPNGLPEQPQPFSSLGGAVVPELRHQTDNNRPQANGTSGASTSVNDASILTAPSGLEAGIPHVVAPTQEHGSLPTSSIIRSGVEDGLPATVLQAPDYHPPPAFPPDQFESMRSLFPNWHGSPVNGENTTIQTLNGGSSATRAETSEGDHPPPENGISTASLENAGRNADETRNEDGSIAPVSTNNTRPEEGPDKSSAGQLARKDRHATVEDLVEDPD